MTRSAPQKEFQSCDAKRGLRIIRQETLPIRNLYKSYACIHIQHLSSIIPNYLTYLPPYLSQCSINLHAGRQAGRHRNTVSKAEKINSAAYRMLLWIEVYYFLCVYQTDKEIVGGPV